MNHNKFLEWLGQHPWHFFTVIMGVCVCFCSLTYSCARYGEAEFKYRSERDKAFYQRSQPQPKVVVEP